MKITVAIPTYNVEKYIERCLDSVKNQTFKDYEILISDDGSTDNTVKIIEEYMKNNPKLNIRLIKQAKNLGVIENRNFLLKEFKGDYFNFIDNDDYIEPECLEELYNAIIKDDADLAIGEYRTVNETGKLMKEHLIFPNATKWTNCGCHHAVLYKGKIIRDNNILEKDVGAIEDVYFTALYASYANKVTFVHKILYNWVIRSGSTGSSQKKVNKLNDVENFHRLLTYVKPIYDNISKNDRLEFEYTLLRAYYIMLYNGYRKASLRNKISAYKKIKEYMLEFDSNYRNNPLIKLNSNVPARKQVRYIIWFSILLEKLHLMPFALTVYHIISKFYFFNV